MPKLKVKLEIELEFTYSKKTLMEEYDIPKDEWEDFDPKADLLCLFGNYYDGDVDEAPVDLDITFDNYLYELEDWKVKKVK